MDFETTENTEYTERISKTFSVCFVCSVVKPMFNEEVKV
jgi:hypothetical protein